MGLNDPLPQRALAAFCGRFGCAPTVLAQAPGRVNLIGEHTDYNDGFVLPCAIDFRTVVAMRPRADTRVEVVAADMGHAVDAFDLVDAAVPHPRLGWARYVRAAFAAARAAGQPVGGACIALAGDVPQGAGLSSSASLQVALLRALVQAHDLRGVDATGMARLAQAAENDFVGCQCGIMDQLISARGEAGHALMIDCRNLHTTRVPLPEDVAVMIVHSRVQRGLVDSAYNERRQQCRQAADALGMRALRDVTPETLAAARGRLPPLVARRAAHVVSENQRTRLAAEALVRGDLRRLGVLMAASHRSMREDFEITVPAVDRLVALLQAAIGDEGGARMTGGGFGGCVVALLPTHRVDAVQATVLREYRSPEGLAPTVWVTRPTAGAGLLPLAPV